MHLSRPLAVRAVYAALQIDLNFIISRMRAKQFSSFQFGYPASFSDTLDTRELLITRE
jgi:hypothetical protein